MKDGRSNGQTDGPTTGLELLRAAKITCPNYVEKSLFVATIKRRVELLKIVVLNRYFGNGPLVVF